MPQRVLRREFTLEASETKVSQRSGRVRRRKRHEQRIWFGGCQRCERWRVSDPGGVLLLGCGRDDGELAARQIEEPQSFHRIDARPGELSNRVVAAEQQS